MSALTNIRHEIAIEVKNMLLRKIGGYVESIILYGSVARGEDREESDIDIECLVQSLGLPCYSDGTPMGLAEKIADIEIELEKRGHLVNIDLRSVSEFEKMLQRKEEYPRNIVKEGIILYNVYKDYEAA